MDVAERPPKDVGAGEVAPGRKRTSSRTAYLEATKIVLGTRAALIVVAVTAAWMLADTQGPLDHGIIALFDRWDGPLFARVAEFGYTDPRTDPHATAFFPLFPLLLRALHATGLSYAAAGMLITIAGSVIAGAFLYRLAEEEIGEGSGRRALLYMMLFPTAVFLVAPYSEALFLAGAVAAFYYARRNRWLMVAVPGAVAVASRSAGLFILFGLVFDFVRQNDWSRKKVLAAGAGLGMAALPVIAYGAYLRNVKGDPFYFFIDQRDGWYREFTGPVSSLTKTWQLALGNGGPTNWIFSWRIELVAAALGVAFTVWALKRREWGYAAYMGATMAAIMTSTWYFSIPRLLLSLFPIYLFLAGWTVRKESRHEYLLAVTAVLAAVGVIVFTRGAWFF